MDAPRYDYGGDHGLPSGSYYARNKSILRELCRDIQSFTAWQSIYRLALTSGVPGLPLVADALREYDPDDDVSCENRLAAARAWIESQETVIYDAKLLNLYGVEDMRELALDYLTLVEKCWCQH